MWYTNKIEGDAIERQAAKDQEAVLRKAVSDKQAEIDQMLELAVEQKRQIRLRDKVYHELKDKTETLRTELAGLASEENLACDALAVDRAVIERLQLVFTKAGDDRDPPDSDIQESVPGTGFVPADFSTAFPGDD